MHFPLKGCARENIVVLYGIALFTVYGENLQNVNQMQIIDTPMAYLPLHTKSISFGYMAAFNGDEMV